MITFPPGFKRGVRWFRKQTFVCVPCRTVRRWPARSLDRVSPATCVGCAQPMRWAERVPARDDDRGWRVLADDISRRAY